MKNNENYDCNYDSNNKYNILEIFEMAVDWVFSEKYSQSTG